MKTKKTINNTVHHISKVESLPQMELLPSSPTLLLKKDSIVYQEPSHLFFPDIYYSSPLQEFWQDFPKEIKQLNKRAKAFHSQFDFTDAYAELIRDYRRVLVGKWLTNRKQDKEYAPLYLECDSSDDIREGKMEDLFYKRLIRDLPYHILRKQKIPMGNYYYYPDIVIVASGLYVDIEIDEPYTEDNGQPIHYVETIADELVSVDALRNDCITAQGWEIIRFAEEQVVKYPAECIAFIDRFITSLLNDGSGRPRMPFLHRIDKWTKKKAMLYARLKYRDKYNV